MCLPVKPFKIEAEWEHHGLKCAVVLAREAEPCAHDDGKGHWLGFDCCHYDDLWLDPTLSREDLPEHMQRVYDMEKEHPIPSWGDGSPRHYWTMDEVKAECERLADQLVTYGES